MSSAQLLLYAVFHINLAFSSIPKSHYPLILDRCYWPLLELAKRMGVPFGFEATGYSLEILEQIDPSYIKALKNAWAQGQVEVVGSSYTQSIFPLTPAEVNARNLAEGMAIYDSLLGQKPTLAYINEQTYSSGCVDLYLDAGYQALFMEWNNPARFQPGLKTKRYQPQSILNPDGTRYMPVLWNDSILFQKLQRVLSQELSVADYFAYMVRHYDSQSLRAIPFYGSDAEIIDYHPGELEAAYLSSTESKDINLLAKLLEQIAQRPQMQWVSPSGVIAAMGVGADPIRLETPEYPLPCKKQEKYNPTRWAVTGREDIHLNTQCFDTFYTMQALESFTGKPLDKAVWRNLLEMWGSDFRTHTTQEKWLLLHQAASLSQSTLADLKQALEKDTNPLHTVLYNPNAFAYTDPIVLELQFSPHLLFGTPQLQPHPAIQAMQIEDIGHYQDGSVRWLKVVLMGDIPPQQTVTLIWETAESSSVDNEFVRVDKTSRTLTIETDAVRLKCITARGGAIESLQFKQLDDQPWVGTLHHGEYDDISLGADWYSGHFVLTSKSGEKVTDLNPATVKIPENLSAYPIRIPVQFGTQTPVGKIWKTIYVYRHRPQIDLLFHFRFKDLGAVSSRVGFMTVLPEAFDPETISYRTFNGGVAAEKFALRGHTVTHPDPVSVVVSAQHGLGATTGWVAIEDSQHRILLRTFPQKAYAMPMIDYRESDPTYFLSVLPSIGEFDETSHTMWRGHHQVMFRWEGQRATDTVVSLQPLLALSPQVTILAV